MKKSIALFILFFALSGMLSAQQKYGHIDSQEILHSMPEYKMMLASLQRKQTEQQNKVQAMYTDYQKRQQELNDLAIGMMEAVREEKMKELDSLQRAISTYQEGLDADMQRLQGKLLKPLNDKYLKIVNAVAKENGYTYIFDVATGNLAYYPETTGDITPLVKKKMGIN